LAGIFYFRRIMVIGGLNISCPKCGWEPDESCRWVCDVCDTRWNTFETHGVCPNCGKVYKDTMCSKRRGGCGQMSLNSDWYEPIEIPAPKEKTNWFWQRKNEPPITETDKEWVEDSLLWLAELFTPEVFRSLVTVTPDKQYFDHDFTATEDDVDFILERLTSIMNIKPWEIQIMYFSTKPTEISEGISATPSEKLKGGWKSKQSELVDKGFGSKEIWIETGQMNNPIGLIATISVELAKYKLTSEYMVEDHVNLFADLTSLVFGFGIFRANSYFKFNQWQGNTHHGWQMQKSGGLPEPVIAYVMAWLAHYRDEDISWKHYLNRTVRKYFDKSYKYIERNKDKIKWSSHT
jgi:hypothetical protein